MPDRVWCGGEIAATDISGFVRRLGGASRHMLLAGDRVAATASEKAALRAAPAPMRSISRPARRLRAASAAGLPFAALRAICDPAERSLPPAALVALDARGAVGFGAVLRSIGHDPGQLSALLTLAAEAWAARGALRRRVRSLRPGFTKPLQ